MAESLLVYTDTGFFKTSQIGFIAKHIYERTGKITRLVSADGGGWKPVEPLVRAGIIDPWNVSSIQNPRSVSRKISQGYWPRVSDKNGKLGIVLDAPTPDTWRKVGAYAVEGLTSFAALIMRDALNKQLRVAGDKLGEKADRMDFSEEVQVSEAGVERTIRELYSVATPGNFLDSQRFTYDFIMNFRSLPIEVVYFTALEHRGEEERTKKTIIGPEVIGQAATAHVGSWVGDQIHFDGYWIEEDDPTHVLTPEDVKAGKKRRRRQVPRVRAWFIRHPDPITGLLFPAKPRVAPSKIAELLKVFPGGYFEPTLDHGIETYLEVVERMQNMATDEASKWKAEVDARRAAEKVGGTDAPKADPALVRATTGGKP